MKGKDLLLIVLCLCAAAIWYLRRLPPDGKEAEAVEIDLDAERAAQLAARLRAAEKAEVAGQPQGDIDMADLLKSIESGKGETGS